jgi:hypothetical protein
MLYLCDVLNMRSNRKGSEKKQQITQKEEKIHNLSKNIQRKGQNKRTRTLSRQIRCRLWARTSHQDSAASKTETVGIVSAPLALRMGGGGVSKESRVIFARMQGSGKDGGESYFVSGSTQRSNSPVAHAALLIGGAVRGALFGWGSGAARTLAAARLVVVEPSTAAMSAAMNKRQSRMNGGSWGGGVGGEEEVAN